MAQTSLEKHFTARSIFAFGVAGMLASGIFLLPGLIYSKVGSTAGWVYLVAGLFIIPTLLSKAELATAMPRAGGAYYVLDRSMGPAVGTVAGLGTWLSLVFKSSFDLIGLGAYLLLFLTLPIKPVAIGLCIGFAILSIVGTKHVGRLQEVMVAIILAGLAYFIATGLFNLDHGAITAKTTWSTTAFLEAVGLVYVSFASLTKIISMAEEVEDLDKNIPMGMFTALAVTVALYLVGMFLILQIVPGSVLDTTLTPVADAAGQYLGNWGVIGLSAAAVLAFSASANAGLTAASRYPLALSRDGLAPKWFGKLGRFQTPTPAIILTVGVMILFILLLNPEGVAKLASAFLLVIFGMLNLAVIIMRESNIQSYDPGFRSPGYPWMQVSGIAVSVVLIPYLGMVPRIAAGGLVGVGLLWYFLYGKEKAKRSSALVHIFSQLGEDTETKVDEYLRQALRERGLREEDSLDDVIYRTLIFRHKSGNDYHETLNQVAQLFSERVEVPAETIFQALRDADDKGFTPSANHMALPHAYLPDLKSHELAVVQSSEGLKLGPDDEPVYALFVLISPTDTARQHLRLLAEIANRADGIDFTGEWRQWSRQSIQEHFLHSETIDEITVGQSLLPNHTIGQLWIHKDCLIPFIVRNGELIIPHGNTIVQKGDTITLIGTQTGVQQTMDWLKDPVFDVNPKPPENERELARY
ncbi:MAG: amino acid permease [Candidatus Marinimicrobia bacterium]|nr:amino acid permease [Candidatus Neomarinimicrobiota bacterium]MCF7828214.1 amino acid permease [Candidatus Neomarinimicrobiota bacterium]MCF7879611.1 amino acid permease [Candidatus Neomarinimicrobiota bacterium]